MILGTRKDREEVIANIERAANGGELNIKVETGDPVLTPEQSSEIIDNYVKKRGTAGFRTKSFVARQLANVFTKSINEDTQIIGLENMPQTTRGAIITSNHFSPLDNTVVRHFVRSLGKKRINIVSQDTNFAMQGAVGFLMNYADIIPIANNHRYLEHDFVPILSELLENNEYVLIYPEQEMWFNYRKPRPLKRGAYCYAAKLNVPVVSCFVEMRDLDEVDTDGFYKVKYVFHILETLYPDPTKSVKENSLEMSRRDFELKKQAYERVYGKKLDYTFEDSDIAGWVGRNGA